MPLQSHKQIENIAELFIWNMSESREELLKIADPKDEYLQSLEKVTHPKRRRELFGLKALLKSISFDQEITYLPNGKPVIDESTHITISHCDHLAGFLRSNVPCGMDIQNPNPKIALIAKRFCNADELAHAERSKDSLLYFTALWSIKESVFKVFGENLPFAEQIRVQEFDPHSSYFAAVNCHHNGNDYFFKVRIYSESEYFIMMAFLEQ